MSILQQISGLCGKTGRSVGRKSGMPRRVSRCKRRPQLEGLEDRQLLAGFAQSVKVAIIGGPNVSNGGTFPTTGADFAAFTFTTINPADVTAANLAQYDTVLLNVASSAMNETTATLTAQEKADLVSFVGSGKKLVIYDSETTSQDYSWLPYQFTTNNPGQLGAHGTLAITEENTLSSADPTNPKFIDANYLSTSTDAVGDSNVFVSFDSHWCADMTATNVNNKTGPVHTYATYSNPGSTNQGLFIYNGLDVDYLGSESNPNGLRKIWLQELQQSFNPVVGLPCAAPVTGIRLDPPTATNQVGSTYTATATLADLLGTPNVGVPVTFTITAGPNMGVTTTLSPADGKTDSKGMVSFSYVGTAAGTDTIDASFVDANGMTIHAVPVSAVWTTAASPPKSVDKTFFSHVSTTITAAAPGVLINDTDPDPAHIPLLKATKVSDPTHGTLTLNPDGSFTYVPTAGFVGQDSFQYQASDGSETGNVATVTLSVFPPLAIGMSKDSDSGLSNTDQITNINTPVFMGTAETGSVVKVFAQQGSQPAVMIGQATTNADGTWSVKSSTLADGTYAVYALETHPSSPGREDERVDLANPVVIDTVGPKVTGETLNLASGQWTVTIQDDRSGLNQTVLVTPANYELLQLHTPASFSLPLTGVTAAASTGATSPQTVTIKVNNGQKLRAAPFVTSVRSGGIVDVAGNALDGEFNGSFPSGNASPGGNFSALMSFLGQSNPKPQALTQFVVDRANLHNPSIPVEVISAKKAATKVKTKHVAVRPKVVATRIVATHHRLTTRMERPHKA